MRLLNEWLLPYSGKLSREKTFTNFAVWGVAWQKQAIHDKFFFAKIVLFTNSRKFSPSKVSRSTVSRRMTVLWFLG